MRVAIGFELCPTEWERLRREFPDVEFKDASRNEAATRILPTCQALFTGRISAHQIEASPQLRWIQSYSAGVDRYPFDLLRARSIVLTNASGAHSIQIAENLLAMMLAFSIRLHDLFRAQQARRWERGEIGNRKQELEGAVLLIAGLGGLGAGLARKAKCLGMHIIGVRNQPLPAPEGVDEIVSRAAMRDALCLADHVALCLPLTPETDRFIGEEELRSMKPTAYIYNAGRGKSLDRDALLQALDKGWIAGAGLDVTDPEPLPPDDPLWSFPNVILTQHTSGGSRHQDRRVTDIFAENLRRFRDNTPLINVVDFDLGY